MPQKYRIRVVRHCADPLIEGYFFSPAEIHESWSGTRDGRFYSKADAVACLNGCYQHYLSRWEAALSDAKPMFDGRILIIGSGIYTVEKAS